MGDSPVMLRAAKHLAAQRDRPFAALRVTTWGTSMSDSTVMLSVAKHLAAIGAPLHSPFLGGYVKDFLCRKVTNKGILRYTMLGLFHFLCSELSQLR